MLLSVSNDMAVDKPEARLRPFYWMSISATWRLSHLDVLSFTTIRAIFYRARIIAGRPIGYPASDATL